MFGVFSLAKILHKVTGTSHHIQSYSNIKQLVILGAKHSPLRLSVILRKGSHSKEGFSHLQHSETRPSWQTSRSYQHCTLQPLSRCLQITIALDTLGGQGGQSIATSFSQPFVPLASSRLPHTLLVLCKSLDLDIFRGQEGLNNPHLIPTSPIVTPVLY